MHGNGGAALGLNRGPGLAYSRGRPHFTPTVIPSESEQSRWFSEEVQPHEPALRAYLLGHFPRLAGHVDDLVQEAYARILRARDGGRVDKPKAYLFVTARNAAFDLFRRNRIFSDSAIVESEAAFVIEDKPDGAETASREQERQILGEAIEALPPRCREILVLRRFHGLSYDEIGRRLGISPNTVNAQLAIAMLRCRDFLDSRGVLRPDHHDSERTR